MNYFMISNKQEKNGFQIPDKRELPHKNSLCYTSDTSTSPFFVSKLGTRSTLFNRHHGDHYHSMLSITFLP